MLFFKIYERREVCLINKYLNRNISTIELGASLGLTTLTICSILGKNEDLYSVEANSKLIPYLEMTKVKNNLSNLKIISAAVDYSGADEISFILDERNLGSSKGSSDNSIFVKTIRLSDIVTRNKINKYNLVCDIEGAEIEMILMEHDTATLINCDTIIIEIHEVFYNDKKYTQSETSSLIEEKFSMICVCILDNIRVFKRN